MSNKIHRILYIGAEIISIHGALLEMHCVAFHCIVNHTKYLVMNIQIKKFYTRESNIMKQWLR